VVQSACPFVSHFLQRQCQHLEVVVLFIAHHVDMAVKVVIIVSYDCGAQVLCHIDRGAVRPEQELLVEPLFGEVDPD